MARLPRSSPNAAPPTCRRRRWIPVSSGSACWKKPSRRLGCKLSRRAWSSVNRADRFARGQLRRWRLPLPKLRPSRMCPCKEVSRRNRFTDLQSRTVPRRRPVQRSKTSLPFRIRTMFLPGRIAKPTRTRTIHRRREAYMLRYPVFSLVLVAVADSACAQSGQPPVCLRALDVDHTKTPNDRTILFFMKDGNIWSATLKSDCPELRFNGFEYSPTPPDNICANAQTIRVLKSGAVCEIGSLVPAAR